MRTTLFVDVIVPLAVPNKYTYRLPAELNEEAIKGKRVLVQFGKTRIYTGIIYAVHEKAPKGYEAKYIEGILDDEPVVTEQQLKFWDWISFYYCAFPGDVMNAALPSGLKLSSHSHVLLDPSFDPATEVKLSKRENQVLDILEKNSHVSFEKLAEQLELKSVHSIVSSLQKKGMVQVYEDIKDRYKPKLQAYVRLAKEYEEERKLHEALSLLEKKAFKQTEVLLHFLHLLKSGESTQGWIKKAELLKKNENASISGLVKKNILIEQDFETGRLLFEKSNKTSKQLSPQQSQAYQEIKKAHSEKLPVLLHGVTGSGKTEIYIQLIKDCLAQGKQVLYLIPEIGLTTQLINRLRSVFGEAVGVYHSRFSENERVEIWNNVLKAHRQTNGANEPGNSKPHYQVILGARSSLFLPFEKLGLVIVDEEHDSSFKQHDPAPRYHARDAAIYLAALQGAHVLLGSGTPAIESYYNALQNKYKLVELKEQFVKGGGTVLEVCDVNYFTQSNQMRASLSPPLFEAMNQALKKKEQIILFQNRRGFAPYTECRKCGHVPQCVQCDVSLIYHKHQQKLVCHYCGYNINPPKTCVACGSAELHYKGLGTEKIEEDIEILFPQARIARMDLDSTRSKYAYKQLIDDFENGQTDILIGTQMVTKGLDFNKVSVVGVLQADSIMNFPDFRSFERAFQLLTQVRGRAGRSSEKGRVYVQTTQAEHKVIGFLKENNYRNFYEDVIKERQQFHYPPFTRLLEINVISKDLNEVNHLANELFKILKPTFEGHLLGPEFPLIAKIKNQFHKRILVKNPRNLSSQQTREFIQNALTELQNTHKEWRYRVNIDVDPV